MEWLQQVVDWLNQPLLSSGEWTLTAGGLIKLAVYPIIVILAARLLRSGLLKVLRRQHALDLGVQNAIISLSYYLFLLMGFWWVLASIGLNTTGLAVFSGGLGLGVGIGLQDLAKNFFAGLILLLGRPIKPGDRITLGDLEADVREIGMYSTKVYTIEDAAVILPNSELLNNQLINWTHNASRRMIQIPMGVHYDSDLKLVQKLLVQAAKENSDVLDTPEPDVLLDSFGDSSINYMIRVWTEAKVHRPRLLISEIYTRIAELFHENNVVIPYPQRDVHFYNETTIEASERANT